MRGQFLVLALLLGACTTRPAFIPPPHKAFAHFRALPRPVRDLPVGALWIEGHGAYGPGAAADNLETLPGITGVTIDSDLSASLTLGFLQYLDLDPSFQRKVSVRLNDVSLVQVRDMARLAGPGAQPRVYAGLRVGSATITTTSDTGVAIEARATEYGLPVFGRGNSGRRSTFSIEVKDVYLAAHVATLRTAVSRGIAIELSSSARTVALAGVMLTVSADPGCRHGTLRATKGDGIVAEAPGWDPRAESRVALAAPVSAGAALFDSVSIRPIGRSATGCSIGLALVGTELVST